MQSNHRPLLAMVILFALLFHAIGIYSLHGLQVTYDSPKRAWFETQRALQEEEKLPPISQEEKKEREEELAEILNALVNEPVKVSQEIIAVEPQKFSQQSVENDLRDVVEQFPNQLVPKIDQKEIVVNDKLVIENLNLTHEEFTIESIDFAEHDALAFTVEGEQDLTNELLKATTVRQGEILVDDIEKLTEEGVKVGIRHATEPNGTALQSRSGLVDGGGESQLKDVHPNLLTQQTFSSQEYRNQLVEKESVEGSLSLEQPLASIQDLIKYNLPENPSGSILPSVEPKDFNEVASIASSEDFSVEVTLSSRRREEGYVFRLLVRPKPGVLFKKIKQNLFFLIDRSHSIDKDRYIYTKQAVSEALSLMNEGDTFNILVFDDSVVRLSEQNLPWTEENITLAREFLKNQEHGGFFASTDIYASLGKIVPEIVADTEVNTAILLSDGDTYLKRDMQRRTIGEWTRRNSGKVSLFSVASGRGNNLALMELLSSFNKGMLSYTKEYRKLSNSLQNLVSAISSPIGKDILVTAVPTKTDTRITFYPRSGELPDLYENLPYVIYGSINNLDDFHLFLQGKYYDKWLDIKQKISFDQAKEGGASIERNWTVLRAYHHYHRFLSDGDWHHLDLAKRLLKPLNVQMAFQ